MGEPGVLSFRKCLSSLLGFPPFLSRSCTTRICDLVPLGGFSFLFCIVSGVGDTRALFSDEILHETWNYNRQNSNISCNFIPWLLIYNMRHQVHRVNTEGVLMKLALRQPQHPAYLHSWCPYRARFWENHQCFTSLLCNHRFLSKYTKMEGEALFWGLPKKELPRQPKWMYSKRLSVLFGCLNIQLLHILFQQNSNQTFVAMLQILPWNIEKQSACAVFQPVVCWQTGSLGGKISPDL